MQTSQFDDRHIAWQMVEASHYAKLIAGNPVITKLPVKKIDGGDCIGISYTTKEGAKHEEWFDVQTRRLVDQTIDGPGGRKLSRHLQRANAFCETMLLRLPEGFTLQK